MYLAPYPFTLAGLARGLRHPRAIDAGPGRVATVAEDVRTMNG